MVAFGVSVCLIYLILATQFALSATIPDHVGYNLQLYRRIAGVGVIGGVLVVSRIAWFVQNVRSNGTNVHSDYCSDRLGGKRRYCLDRLW